MSHAPLYLLATCSVHHVLRLAELLVELCGVLAGVPDRFDQVEAHVWSFIAATRATLACALGLR